MMLNRGTYEEYCCLTGLLFEDRPKQSLTYKVGAAQTNSLLKHFRRISKIALWCITVNSFSLVGTVQILRNHVEFIICQQTGPTPTRGQLLSLPVLTCKHCWSQHPSCKYDFLKSSIYPTGHFNTEEPEKTNKYGCFPSAEVCGSR